jgi:hypothetical protein
VILESEKNTVLGKKTPEGLLDGVNFDIKGVEGDGKRNVRDKISEASAQGCKTIVLYFHYDKLFTKQRINRWV